MNARLVVLLLASLAVSYASIDVDVTTVPPNPVTLADDPSAKKPNEYEGEFLMSELNKAGFVIKSKVESGELGIKAVDFRGRQTNFCVPKKFCKVFPNGHLYFTKWSTMKAEGIDTKELRLKALGEFGTDKKAPDTAFMSTLQAEAVVGPKCEGPSCTGSFKKGDKPIAIIVLGPSASGKSFITQQYLDQFLELNKLPKDVKFHTVDGGKIREVSSTWKDAYDKCIARPMSSGCKDLYDDEAFSKGFKVIKSRISKQWTDARENIMIVETLAGPLNLKVKEFYKKVYKPLTKNYHVLLMAVYASRHGCQYSGSTRAVREGKAYPSNNGPSWNGGMSAVEAMFNLALEYEKTRGTRRTTFAVLRNNFNDEDMSKSNPHYKDCEADIMKHMDCRLKANPFKTYSPSDLDGKQFRWVYEGNNMLLRATDGIMSLATHKDGSRTTPLDEDDSSDRVENDIEEESEKDFDKTEKTESIKEEEEQTPRRRNMSPLSQLSRQTSRKLQLSQRGNKLF